MGLNRESGRIRLGLLLILAGAAVLLGGGLVVGHRVRKQLVAKSALVEADTAFEAQEWATACKLFRRYLSRYPEDEGVLLRFAEANLAVRPIDPRFIRSAITAYRQVLRNRPGDKELCHRLIGLYLGAGDANEAAYVCRQRLQADPSDADAMQWLGQALLSGRRRDEALETLKALVEQHPEMVEAYAMMSAAALQGRGSVASEEAAKWLDLGVERNPESAGAYAHRARFRRTVRKDRALATADLEAAGQATPRDVDVVLRIAEEWIQWGKADRAAPLLSAIEDTVPFGRQGFDPETDGQTVRWFIASGQSFLMRGETGLGAALADRALSECPEYVRRAFLPVAAELYLASGRIDEARQALGALELAAEIGGGESTLFAASATVLLRAALASAEGKHYEAMNLLEDLVAREPRNARGWKGLWRANDAAGRLRRASEALGKYVGLAPGDLDAVLALARSLLAEAPERALELARRVEQGQPGEAAGVLVRMEAELNSARGKAGGLEVAERLLSELMSLKESHPRLGGVRTLLAQIALMQGRVSEATAELEQAVVECGHPAAVAAMLAQLHLRAGNGERAVEVCRSAIAQASGLASPRITLAEVLAAQGKMPEARHTLAEAVETLTGEERWIARFAQFRQLAAMKDRPEAMAVLRQLSADRPHDARPILLLLEQPEVRADASGAGKLIEELRSIEGERGIHWRYKQADLLLHGGNRGDRQEEIVALLRQCMEGDAAWSAPVLALGRMYEEQGRNGDAEKTYRKSLASHPNNPEVASGLLVLLKRQRRFSAASDVLDGVWGYPLSLGAHRVDVALGLGETDRAMEVLRARIAAGPRDVSSRAVLAGLVYAHGGDLAEAERLLDEAASLDPDSLEVVARRAEILRSEGRDDEALALVDAEVERRGDSAAYRMRAEFHLVSGREALAEEDFARLVSLAGSAGKGQADLGRFYLRLNRYEEAAGAFERALETDPGDYRLRRVLMKSLVRSGDEAARRRGLNMLDALMARRPDDSDLLFVQAVALLEEDADASMGRVQSLLARCVEIDPYRTQAHLLLVQIARREGNRREAAKAARRAIGANPKDWRLRLLRAGLEAELGNTVVARELAEAVLDADVDNVEARTLLARIALGEGDAEAALGLVGEALGLAQEDAGVRVLQAQILEELGRRDEAVGVLEPLCQDSGRRGGIGPLLALAGLYQKEGRSREAEQRIEEALGLEPGNPEAVSAQLRLFAAERRFDELRARLDARSKTRPVDGRILMLGASLLASGGQMEQARAAFEEVTRLLPDRVEGHLRLGQSAYVLGDVSMARRSYRRVLELEPDHRQALNDLGWILGEEMGNAEEGLALVERALAKYPEDATLLDTRGVLLERLERTAEARLDLERSLELSGEGTAMRAHALFHLGRVLVKLGEAERGRRLLIQAREMDRERNLFANADREEIGALLRSSQ